MVSLTEVKTYLRLTDTTYDILLQAYIGYVTTEIEAYLNNLIYPVRNITNEPIVVLNEEGEYSLAGFPVRNVIVKKNTLPLINGENYYLDLSSGTIYFNEKLEKSTSVYAVDYTCGYDLTDVPVALKFVALQAVKGLFDANKGTATPGSGAGDVKSKKIGDFSVSYGGDSNENSQYAIVQTVVKNNISILNKYMRVILF